MTSWKNEHGEELLFVSSKVLHISTGLSVGLFASNLQQRSILFYWTEVLHDQFNLLLPAVNVIFTKKNSCKASFVHQSAWSVLQQNGIFVRYSPQNAIRKRELFEFCSCLHGLILLDEG